MNYREERNPDENQTSASEVRKRLVDEMKQMVAQERQTRKQIKAANKKQIEAINEQARQVMLYNEEQTTAESQRLQRIIAEAASDLEKGDSAKARQLLAELMSKKGSD
jgi:DNA-binding transcriptional regulator/RsmH inhibitor MraZ